MRVSIFLAFIIVGVLVSHPNAYSAGRCEISVGDKVSFRDPVEFYESMQGTQLVKDEFETTAAFERRVAKAESVFNFNEPILLRGIYYREHVNYNADGSLIVVKREAWDKISSGSVTTLQSNERNTGTFTGSNAYGVSVEVTQTLKSSYGVKDPRTKWGETKWEWGRVSIPMSVEKAKRIISKLQVGFLVKPKIPFVAEETWQREAKFSNPIEVSGNSHFIVAEGPMYANIGSKIL